MAFFEDVVNMIDARPEFREELKNAVRMALLGTKLESVAEIRMLLEAGSRDHQLRRRISYEFENAAQRHGWDLGLWNLIELGIGDDELELIAGGDYDPAGESWSHRAWTLLLLASEIPEVPAEDGVTRDTR